MRSTHHFAFIVLLALMVSATGVGLARAELLRRIIAAAQQQQQQRQISDFSAPWAELLRREERKIEAYQGAL